MSELEQEDVDVEELLARINSNLEYNTSQEHSDPDSLHLEFNDALINLKVTQDPNRPAADSQKHEENSLRLEKDTGLVENILRENSADFPSSQKKNLSEKKEKSIFTIVRDTPEEKEEIDQLAKALERIELVNENSRNLL